MQICVAVIFCKLSQYVFTLYSGAHPVHRRFVFSADMLSSMKRGAYIVNTARGKLAVRGMLCCY